MEFDRHEFYEELKLRKVIREGIREIFTEEKKKSTIIKILILF